MLSIKDLTVRFDQFTAIDSLNLQIDEGQVFGLLGPNGAGKTTLIRSLMGLQAPTKGNIQLFDTLLPGSKASKQLIGYMPQLYAVYDQLTVKENLQFFGELYSVGKSDLKQRIDELLHSIELEQKADTLVQHLSGGMKRRVMMATALVHRPRLLILDEPTAGVDPVLRVKFWQWFRELCNQGTSIMVTTHHISEAEACDQIVFLRSGSVIGQGSPSELIQQYQRKNLDEVFVDMAQQQEVEL